LVLTYYGFEPSYFGYWAFEIRHNYPSPDFNSDGTSFTTQSNRSISPIQSYKWLYDGVLDWILDLLTTLIHNL
jgi:hypothetical protein